MLLNVKLIVKTTHYKKALSFNFLLKTLYHQNTVARLMISWLIKKQKL